MTLARIPTSIHHGTAAARTALTTQYGITTALPDQVIRMVGQEAVNLVGLGSPQLQQDVFLALLRERHVK